MSKGIEMARGASEIYERTNDMIAQASYLQDVARSLYYDDQLDAAEDTASRAIGLVPEKGQEHLLCRLHRTLGMIHEFKGEKERAVHHFKTALGIASPFNWHDVLFWNHLDLAEDEFDEASAHIEQAKSHAIDNTYWLGCAIRLQARVLYRQGRFEDAKSEALHAH
jgi:tetratricopeptide (TPR) repeat protein